ncbi:MAG: protein kinase [Anaerolineae bacterium]|nr:protein kinase [Anaerolineae bacterium]
MDSLSGKAVKGYVLVERIGEGGFGSAYRAFDTNVLNREVVVKIILAKYANDPVFIRRFESEAQIIASLEHPHIIPLYDYWREPDNAFIVLRWMPGGTLKSRLDDGALPLASVSRILEQLLPALSFAHRHRVIHRDITPRNILFDNEGNVVLADFGISKQLDKEGNTGNTAIGSVDYLAPEQTDVAELSPATDVFSFGLVLFEMLTGRHPFDHAPLAQVYRDIPALSDLNTELPNQLEAVVNKALAKAANDRYQSALELLAAYRAAVGISLDTGSIASISDTRNISRPVEYAPNPYKGIEAFQERDADQFYGRNALISQLLSRLAKDGPDERFLAVVGPSGSGKSSVVKAGLLPKLRQGALAGSDAWFFTEMVPGSLPFVELETALLRVAVNPGRDLIAVLQRDNQGILRATKQILPPDESIELVLVIDQFEELFSSATDSEQRELFLDSIIQALRDQRSRLRVIVTMRADFYDRPLQYREFGELLRKRMETVLPLSRNELIEAIIQPAQAAGVRFEDGLVNRIMQELGGGAGILPLLQYALKALFDARQGDLLTHARYTEIGGVTGALAQRAEDIFWQLTEDQQETAKQLFVRLVTPGEGTEDTRRRVRMDELESIAPEHVDTVIEAFSSRQNRMLILDRDEDTRVRTVEVAHEALIRSWDRLRGWLNEEREGLLLQRRLSAMAVEWHDGNKDPGLLATGLRLAQLETWVNNTTLTLNDVERDFLESCIKERLQREQLEAERQELQQLTQQRATNRLRYIMLIALIFALVTCGLSLLAFNQANTATTERDRAGTEAANARRIAEEANSLSWAIEAGNVLENGNQQLANALALNALRMPAPPIIAQNAASKTLLSPGAIRQIPSVRHKGTIWSVVFSPDGDNVLSASADHSLILWDVHSGAALRTFTGHGGSVNGVTFSPDGNNIVSASEDHSLILWDVHSGAALRTFTGHEGPIYDVVYSPDGQSIASSSEDGTLILWDVTSGEPLRTLTGHTDRVRSVAFSPDGRSIVSGSEDGTLILWDVASGDARRTFAGHSDWVQSVTFSPDGQFVVSASDDSTLILWDAASGEMLRTFTEHTAPVKGVAYSPDGQSIISASEDNTLILWDVASGNMMHTFTGHSGAIWSVAFSPDGRSVMSASVDHKLILWDVTSGEALHTFTGHSGSVNGVAFSPDGQFVVSASEDNTLILWDVTSGEALRTFTRHSDWVRSVAFSLDGNSIASASEDNTLILWDVASGEALRTFTGHTGSVNGVAFSPNGQFIVSASSDNTLILWDTATGEAVRRFTGHSNRVRSVAFSPDGKYLVSGSFDNSLILWDVSSAQIVRTFTGHSNWVWSVAFSPDGKYIVSVSEDKTVILWDVTTGEPVRTFTGHPAQVWSVAYSPDGRTVVSASNGELLLWNVVRGDLLRTYTGHTGSVNAVAYSPDAQFFVSASSDRTLKLWDTTSGAALRTFTGHADWVRSVAYSPDGQSIASASDDKTLILWDVVNGTVLHSYAGHTRSVTAVAFSPDDQSIASASEDNTLILWDVSSSEALRTFTGHSASVNDVAFSPDGQWIVSASDDSTLILWDVDSGKVLRTFTGHSASVNSVAFSPHGKWIVSASDDSTLVLWDVDSGKVLRTFTGHSASVNSVAFSPDGKWIISASDDNTLILWDVESGEAARNYVGHRGIVRGAVFSPDGQSVVSASADNTLILWDVDTLPALIQWTFSNRLIRELTCEERQTYNIGPFCRHDVAQYPTWTPYPTLTPVAVSTPLPASTL